jgi:aryl-alcohol dehydrogenase-like predicted oxidoreductase
MTVIEVSLFVDVEHPNTNSGKKRTVRIQLFVRNQSYVFQVSRSRNITPIFIHKPPLPVDKAEVSCRMDYYYLVLLFLANATIVMSTANPIKQKSLFLKEAAFIDAAIEATSHFGDDLKDDPKATDDTEAMIAIARRFLTKSAPSLLEVLDKHPDLKSTADRLIKIGRNVSSTLRNARRSASSLALTEKSKGESIYSYSKEKIDASLRLLADECMGLADLLKGEAPKVPKVRFGKTALQMPVVTLGCMRFQQSWNRGSAEKQVLDMTKVEDECQKNLVEILRYAYQCGVTHIEAAKGYGSSQLQLGFALKEMFDSGEIKREDLIIQTKVPVSSSMSIQDFKDLILDSIKLLQLDYIDLFSVHGLNFQQDFDLLFSNPKGNLIEACKQLKQEGKVRHVGFSSHAPAKLIEKAIETDAFEYVNLHHQFCGSYTCTGDLELGGNLSNVRLAHEKDMGVFIISAYDKGKLSVPGLLRAILQNSQSASSICLQI